MKKAVVYTPFSAETPPISDNLQDIPQYDDKGISYKGYAKIPLGNRNYKLKKQDTRFYAIGYAAGSSSITFNRTNYTTHSYHTQVVNLTYRFAADTIVIIYDGQTSAPKFSQLFLAGSGTINFNFDSIIRSFLGSSIIIATTTTAGAAYSLTGTEIVYAAMYGWDEEI